MDRTMRWNDMPIGVQISNIGSEVSRAIRWKNKNETEKMMEFYRKAIELLKFTEEDPKNKNRINELRFCEEELSDFFTGINYYGTTQEQLEKYYDAFIMNQ